MDNFSIRFSTLRKTLKVSQQEMAQKMKVTQKTLSSWEQGHNEPCSSLSELVTSYNINLNWLLTGKGKMFTDKSGGNEKNVHDIPFLLNKNNSLSIPMLISQNESSSLVAFTQDNMIYIINTGVNKYIKKANYLLEKNEIYYIRNIDMTLDNNFEICEINNHDSKGHTFSLEELQKFKIVGMVEYSLKVEVQRVS